MSTVVFGEFEWDSTKAETNLSKHGVSFAEAASVFGDPNALVYSNDSPEGRLVLIGFSSEARILFVVHAEVEESGRVRIVSARRATKSERKRYA